MGMSMHDRYYEPVDDDYDSDDVADRVAELMKTEDYDPTDISHIAEAISEASAEDQATIRDYIQNKEWDKLGMKLFDISYNYMEHFAESHAEEDLATGYRD